MPTAKAAVIEKMAGFFIGKTAFWKWSTSTQTVFERRIIVQEESAPTSDRHEERREVRGGGDREGEADHERDVLALEEDAEADGDDAEDDRGDLRGLHLLLLRRVAALDDGHVDVVGVGRGAREGDGSRADFDGWPGAA